MKALVLDSEAFSRLARARRREAPGSVLAALEAALRADAEVLVPAAVLAEQYRGGSRDQVVDTCLGRHTGIQVVDTDRVLARRVGNVLSRAGRGSADHVDATVVAVAASAGGAVVLTGDPDDLGALADGLLGVFIEQL